jgi:hypothetical protein
MQGFILFFLVAGKALDFILPDGSPVFSFKPNAVGLPDYDASLTAIVHYYVITFGKVVKRI